MKIKFLNYNKNLEVIPDLLILIFSPVAAFYHHIIYDISFIAYYSIIFLLFTLVSLSLYIKLYKWRNLQRSVSSFIFFFLNIVQLALYLSAISFLFHMCFYNSYRPIYLNDISIISQYRYLFLSVVSIFLIILYFFAVIFKLNIQQHISTFSFPYLHEEVRCIIDSWGNGRMGVSFINKLSISKYYRYMYCSLDCLSVLFRIIMVLLFIYFCFFGGNLYYLLYFSPIAFLFWLLSFFTYFINWIIEGNSTVIRECLELSPIDPNLLPSGKTGFSFKITSEAIKQGFTENDLDFLVGQWLELGSLMAFLQYRRFIKYFSFGIVTIYFISWCYISYYFFCIPSQIVSANLPPFSTLFRRSSFWHPPISRSPRDMRHLHERYQNPLKVISQNEFAIGHPVYGELLPDGTYRIDGYFTRNPNYGVKIPTTPIMANKAGNNQNAVAFSTPLIVPATYVTLPVPGSMAILEATGVKAVLDHIEAKP